MTVRHAGDLAAACRYDAGDAQLLRLHLLTRGRARIAAGNTEAQDFAAPAIAVLRGDCGHMLAPPDDGMPASLLDAEARFTGPASALLLDAFARPLLVPLDESEPELDMVVQLIATEVTQPRCGHPALLSRAVDILFIGLLRHLIAHPRTDSGLLSGLSDPRIARALVAIHRAPLSASDKRECYRALRQWLTTRGRPGATAKSDPPIAAHPDIHVDSVVAGRRATR